MLKHVVLAEQLWKHNFCSLWTQVCMEVLFLAWSMVLSTFYKSTNWHIHRKKFKDVIVTQLTLTSISSGGNKPFHSQYAMIFCISIFTLGTLCGIQFWPGTKIGRWGTEFKNKMLIKMEICFREAIEKEGIVSFMYSALSY